MLFFNLLFSGDFRLREILPNGVEFPYPSPCIVDILYKDGAIMKTERFDQMLLTSLQILVEFRWSSH